MENKSNNVLLTKNNQPIKEITKQDISDLKDHFEQLLSWRESLHSVKEFFGNQEIPLNEKKIMREFHSQSRIFNVFYENFALSVDTLEMKIERLMEKETVKKEIE